MEAGEFNQKVGKRLRDFRIARNLKQQDIADAIPTSRASISRYEKGESYITVEVLLGYSKCLNVPVETFLKMDDNLSLSIIKWFEEMPVTYKDIAANIIAAIYDSFIESRDGKLGGAVDLLRQDEEYDRRIRLGLIMQEEIDERIEKRDYTWLKRHFPDIYTNKRIRELRENDASNKKN